MKNRFICLLLTLAFILNMGGVAFAEVYPELPDDSMLLPDDGGATMLDDDMMMPGGDITMLPDGAMVLSDDRTMLPNGVELTPSENTEDTEGETDLPTSGTDGYVDWSVENSVLTISKAADATGAMKDYNTMYPGEEPPWFWHFNSIKSVVIEEDVTSIGSYAFYGIGYTTSVTIPSTVTSIGDYAFAHNIYLPAITIPASVTDIGTGVFINCQSIKTAAITAGTSNVSVGSYAFYYCTGLSSITLPANVTSIGQYVFAGCDELETAGPISEEATYNYQFGWTTTIPDNAFQDCMDLESVTLPDTITDIGDWAFSNCIYLETVTFPKGLESIGEYAFSLCLSLTAVELPESVSSIGKSAFVNCSELESVNIPAGVTALNAYTFAFCEALTDIYFDGSAPSIAGNCFEDVGTAEDITTRAHYIPGKWTEEQMQNYGGKLTWTVYIKSIQLDALPAKLLYYKGESFDPTGIEVSAIIADGTSAGKVTDFELTGFDSTSGGEKTLTVSYAGRTATFSVYVFSFTSVTLSLDGRVIINFYANFPGKDTLNYTPGILFFSSQPDSAAIKAAYDAGKGVTDFAVAEDGSLMFSYKNTAAKEMNDRIYAVLYAVHPDGSAIFGTPSPISVAQYVSLVFNSYADDTPLQKLMVDMLNYGAAAQKHFNYNTGALANASLTSAQNKLGTAAAPSLSSAMKLYNDSLSSPLVSIISASLSLDNEITVNFYAEIGELEVTTPPGETPEIEGDTPSDDPEGDVPKGDTPSDDPESDEPNGDSGEQETPQPDVTVYPVSEVKLLLFDGYTEGGTYDLQSAKAVSDMVKSGDYYAGFIPNIAAKSMRDLYHARVYVKYANGEEAYSGIGQYSVETYAYTVKSGSAYSANLKALTESMMKYGDSAKAYFAK